MNGKAIIFSAPSGAGKTTIVKELIQKFSSIQFSVSATTRAKRPSETDGKDYYFLSEEVFKQKIAEGQLLEWEEVYRGVYYGTLKEEVNNIWSQGNHVIFDVDVKGGIHLKKALGSQALSVFVKVPSAEVLKNRLQKRATESNEEINTRIEKAIYEMQFEKDFDEVVINEDLPKAIDEAAFLVQHFIS